jgi:hypothetical protein
MREPSDRTKAVVSGPKATVAYAIWSGAESITAWRCTNRDGRRSRLGASAAA